MTATAGRRQPAPHGERSDAAEALRDRMARLPAENYPVQHATIRFHLGVALAHAGNIAEAEEHLVVAARLFGSAPLPVEEAKALNALGGVLRLDGRPEAAAEAFTHAARRFKAHGRAPELAAATYNLALAHKDLGASEEAVALLRRAFEITDASKRPLHAATVATELGASLLETGDLAAARAALEEAHVLARRAGNLAVLGAAANTLGLVHLAAGRPDEAASAFEEAVAAHPRPVRPQEHAMAKSNRAVALERAGEEARARLAALQALTVPEAAAPVRKQAEGVVARLGTDDADLLTAVLDERSDEARAGLIREELIRLVAAGDGERLRRARAWVAGVGKHEDRARLLEVWFGAALELPPGHVESVLHDLVVASEDLDGAGRDRFLKAASRAMIRFHVPQWTRLKQILNRIASARGWEATWD